MTCREKLKQESPHKVNDYWAGGCHACPHTYGYLEKPEYCDNGVSRERCRRCWDREIPDKKTPDKDTIKELAVNRLLRF